MLCIEGIVLLAKLACVEIDPDNFQYCWDTVTECALDEGDLEWCIDDYKQYELE